MILTSVITPAFLFLAEHTDKPWYQQDWWRIPNLIIFLIFLVYILVKKVRVGQVFDDRAATILKELEQARHDKEEAQRQLAEVEARFSRLDEEVARIRAES